MKDRTKLALSLLKQHLMQVLAMVEIENLDLKTQPPAKAKQLEELIRKINTYGKEITESLSRQLYLAELPVLQGSEELLSFYENSYLPIEEEISNLSFYGDTKGFDFISFLEKQGISTDLKNIPSVEHTPIRDIYDLALEQIDILIDALGDDLEEYYYLDESDLKLSRQLLNSEYFKPDNWAINLSSLRPIITSKTSDKLPRHIRIRIKEIYSSFTYGNWLSVLSASRALLEYVLLDTHSRLGFTAYEHQEENLTPSPLPLSLLIKNASERLPDIASNMENIKTYGNEVMHPRINKKSLYIPAGRIQALDCITKLRVVLHKLYKS
ncbi:hypothetical protein [Marinospirillum insulare]|uniref:DUF4145 domain-containing protein n=1 Tax=Marinospirillum insulare TaxID=217169 RepID=A0ABQ5ZYK1_9GAMM|nr:hypothetical protein [Marinospirillum insulare]GLR63063.1 hypothetical protein GCM10007878_04980 [Marinospirillum insulare]